MDTGLTQFHGEGVVVKKNIGSYTVRMDGKVITCGVSSKLRKELVYSSDNLNAAHRAVQNVRSNDHTDPVAVGDRVLFHGASESKGTIVEVLPRRNRLAREDPAPEKHKFEQVIVANIDMLMPIFAAASPTPKWGLLDRYLASAESLGLACKIIITKMDLVKPNSELAEEIEWITAEYSRIGYPVLRTSSVSGEGLAELKAALKDRTSAFVGKSGVGKTALLNALEPGLGHRVGAVSEGKLGKGRHTTTGAEMVPLSFGGDIIDTPGIREFGLFELDGEELAYCFPEMRPYLGQCKFGLDCNHDEEPGCAIRKAVMAGAISPRRYQSYMNLKKEL